MALALCAAAAPGQAVVDPLAEYTARVDTAVDRGLDYLASVQKSDGAFPGKYGRTVGVVGLCGMAFLAKGYMPGHADHGRTLNRCIDYCLGFQDAKNGYMGRQGGKMYSHNIGTLFLLEVSGMVDMERQRKLDAALSKAVKLIVTAQRADKGSRRHDGGWRYHPNSKDSDLSCSGWAVMALRSARLNGVHVPDKTIEDAVAYLLRNHDPQRGTFGYQDARNYHITLTGAGLLCLELTGRRDEESAVKAGEHLLRVYDQLPRQSQFVYGLYYTSQATFQLGGKYWERFGPWMYDYWLPKQQENGSWRGGAGNWEPREVAYYTAMSVLAFTVPYRQLPIYQRDETVDEEEGRRNP